MQTSINAYFKKEAWKWQRKLKFKQQAQSRYHVVAFIKIKSGYWYAFMNVIITSENEPENGYTDLKRNV